MEITSETPSKPAASAVGAAHESQLLRFFVGPFVGYVFCYLLLTFPLVLSWSKVFWCNSNDGYQMVWNLWWVRHALLNLHQLPWHTSILKYPDGVTLLLHSLAPLDGVFAMPLAWLGQVRAYNTIIILTFALSGLTAFWLAYDQTCAYWPSLVGGYAFTFSAIHFAHAGGHLHQISNEFAPLFLLLWLRFLKNPNIRYALASAICLLLVLLCDQYLFCFCLAACAIAIIWKTTRTGALAKWNSRPAMLSAICFIGFTLCSSAVLIFATLRAAAREPLVGTHNPEIYSPSFTGLITPGWQWQWHELLWPIWTKLGSYEETTVSIGIGVLILAIFGVVLRKRIAFSSTGLWTTIAIIFTLLALGPTWRLWYEPLTTHTPYRLLMWLIPAMQYSGCPGRMMVMTQLACSVLAAAGLKSLATFNKSPRLIIGGLLMMAIAIESQPRLPDTSSPDIPKWVEFVRDYPGDGPVIDAITKGDAQGMYFQTIHHHPMAGGYISRTPASVEDHSLRLFAACDDGDVAALSPFRLIITLPGHAKLPLPVVYQDRFAVIYENSEAVASGRWWVARKEFTDH